MQSKIIFGMLAGGCLLTSSLSMAAVTVNGSGSYATINEALNNAAAGATLEITDSATYTENIHITLNGIILRAAAGQTPSITGIAAAHPVSPTSMPVKWHGGAQDTTFNAAGATIVNSGTGVTIQGLTVNAGAAGGALDLRFGTATVQNCTIDATGKVAGILSLKDQTLTGLTVTGATDSIITQGTGTLTLANSVISGGSRPASFLGGTINATNTQLIDNNLAVGTNGLATLPQGVIIGNTYGDITTNFDHVVFRSNATQGTRRIRVLLSIDGTGPAGLNHPGGTWGPGAVSFTATHCDFIGAITTDTTFGDFLDNHAISQNTGRLGWVMTNFTVTNSNIQGSVLSPINIRDSINEPNPPYGIRPDELTITNNYFYKTFNNINDQCDVLGNYGWCARNAATNVQSYGPWHPLYVNDATGDFKVASDSPAATAASGGGATGALGVGGPAVKTHREWTVSQSGTADFTSIQAAYDAAVSSDVITILDSSTYNENLNFAITKSDIHLRSLPGLVTRPVVSGTADNIIRPWTVRLAGDSRRVTLMGIDFDGSNLAGGGGSSAFRFEDAGQSVVKDCSFKTANNVDWCMLISPTRGRWFIDGTILHQTPGFGAVFQGGFGNTVKFQNYTINSTASPAAFFIINIASLTLDIDNMNIVSQGPAVEQRNSVLDIRNSHVKSGGQRIIHLTAAANSTAHLYTNILEATGKTAGVPEQWGISTDAGVGDATIMVDNCDLYGGPDGTVGVWLRNDGDRGVVKDTIVSNFAAFAFLKDTPGETPAQVFTGRAATYGKMDYNVLVNAPDPQDVKGPNSIFAPSVASVYVNAPTDFHLAATSPAIGVNSSTTAAHAGAVPNYAGSQGPSGSKVSDWSMYQ